VDKVPPVRASGLLLIHYGSPAITANNLMLLPVKTTAGGDFQIEARDGNSGNLAWSMSTDYILPNVVAWTPSFNIAVTRNNRLWVPGAGGKLLLRDNLDSASANLQSLVFYGKTTYEAQAAAFNTSVRINTPLTVDDGGNVYFGFIADAGNPGGLRSGVARVSQDGSAKFLAASDLAGDAKITKLATNAAPALSNDQKTLYISVNTGSGAQPVAYLLALDSATLAIKTKVELRTPTNNSAVVGDTGTSSPLVGPDGDVYYGVLENGNGHNSRGWLLHYDATLATTKTPGSFGWDNTPSIVPAKMVPSYTGSSSYLLLSKYNNYFGTDTGDGKNRMAILDPNGQQPDSIPTTFPLPQQPTVMKEVMTILGATPDPDAPGGVYEWCVNTAVVDVQTKSVLMNSEDGVLYRWDLVNNTFSERIRIDAGRGQAYTPTLIGPGGIVYSINNAILFAVGK
jgi:hypothetical protein